MYKIDWEKYLSHERSRKPESKAGQAQAAGELDLRNEFDSDFGRVIFSTAARRMHDKTQVFPLTSGDYVHTRLTHSLEVMNLAVSLGSSLCRNAAFVGAYGREKAMLLEQQICAVLKTAAFVHDIGNPPFGHYGEDTIKSYFKSGQWEKYAAEYDDADRAFYEEHKRDFTEFDGNAEGFRILAKGQYLGDLYGLNLTFAVLGAFMKYPNAGPGDKKGYVGQHKHGVFATEEQVFRQVAEKCSMLRADGSVKRHPLSFLVEAADTICYTVMDIEDGMSIGKITVDDVCGWADAYIEKHADNKYFTPEMTENGHFSLKKLIGLKRPPYEKKYDVNFRVALISFFVRHAITCYMRNLEAIDRGTYSMELLADDPLMVAETLGKFARKNLFTDSSIVSAELAGASVVSGLLDLVLEKALPHDAGKDLRIFRMLSDSGVKLVHHECGLYDPAEGAEFEFRIDELPLYYRLRLVVDWISGMTDKFALETYQRLSGIRL